MKKIILTIRNSFEEKHILEMKNGILCSLSGGQDSSLVLFLILHFQKEFNFQVKSFYCHHFIQLKNFFCFWQIVRINYLFNIPVSMIFSTKELKNENNARNWRQKSFERISQLEQGTMLLLGHTASDRLETVISNLKRGTSSQGLISFSYKNIYQKESIFIFFPHHFLKKKKEIQVFFCISNVKQIFLKNFTRLWSLTLKPEKKGILKKIKPSTIRFFDYKNISKMVKLLQSCPSFAWLFLKTNKNPLSNNRVASLPKVKIYFSKNSTKTMELKSRLTFDFILLFHFNYSIHSCQLEFSVVVFRPIFLLHRNDVGKICKIFKLPIINDNTNDLTQISRNQIRHQIIPLIRYFFYSKIDFFTCRYLDILMLEQHYINYISKNLFQILLNEFDLKQKNSIKTLSSRNGKIFLKELSIKNKIKIRKLFKNLTIPLQRLCIGKIFFSSTSTQLTYHQIEFLRILIQKV